MGNKVIIEQQVSYGAETRCLQLEPDMPFAPFVGLIVSGEGGWELPVQTVVWSLVDGKFHARLRPIQFTVSSRDANAMARVFERGMPDQREGFEGTLTLWEKRGFKLA